MSAAVGSTTREAVTRMYGRNKGILGATATSARLEERPLLSETEARLLDPDEVIILGSPQHPIKAQRIKYYGDPQFKAMVEQQEGRDYPYPPSVEGVGTWVDGGDGSGDVEEEVATGTLRSRRRQARAMRAVTANPNAGDLRPEDMDRDDGVPPEWERVLDRQEIFIGDLLTD